MPIEFIEKESNESYIRETYDSFYDVCTAIEATKEGGKWVNYGLSASLRSRFTKGCRYFYTFADMEAWIAAYTEQTDTTYQEVVTRAETLAKGIDIQVKWQTTEAKRQRKWANTGSSFSRARLYNGHALKPFRQHKRQSTLSNRGSVTLLIPLGAYADTEAYRIQNAAVSAFVLATALERQGRSCEIHAIATSLNIYQMGSDWVPWFFAVKLKSANRRANLFNLAPILFADFPRRTLFRLKEKNMVNWRMDNSYGKAYTGSLETAYTIDDYLQDWHVDSDNMIMSLSAQDSESQSEETVTEWVINTLESLND